MSATRTTPSFVERHHFLIRRLHSLTGIVPVGAFLIVHLLTNSEAFLGAENFDWHVGLIHRMPFLLAVEISFIFAPLAFHAVYGVLIALQGRSNVRQYPYMDNWRYSLQRLTAWITVAFIVIHLLHFRFAHWVGGVSFAEAHAHGGFFAFTQQGFLNLWLPAWAWQLIYIVGLLAAVYHFCNGVVTFCITWGLTVGDYSRKCVSVGAAGLGLVLVGWGGLSLAALTDVVKPADAQGHAPPAAAMAQPTDGNEY